ncbi:DUF2911 domain-containing protein [Tunicatimonas pelagia]|uniref:DUF2911 domain-containing protein n=1 Tax=Tunicatimonas pelagia TaxID=931531 RepID=UPI002666FFD2|nr:DUF2911 domain-containing protein [Tunicatimonas pelagia]WKN41736.1 DUF2911 domain-containing protein [Tunicatimonas pelagia]
MKLNSLYIALSLTLCCFLSQTAFSQKALEAKPSPLNVAAMKQGDTYVKVVYSRPHKRDRKVFGGLVPYGDVWRLGANEATEITLTQDLTLGGQKLAAGTYSMYAIPEEDKWTVIFNNALGEWGHYNYDEKKDALRIEAPTSKTEETYEPFTIMFNEAGTEMIMAWEDTKVVVPVSVAA